MLKTLYTGSMVDKVELLEQEKFLKQQIQKSSDMFDYLEDHEDLDKDHSLRQDMDKIYKESIMEYKQVVKELYVEQEK